MDKEIQVKYYINPPTFIYTNCVQIYFSGFLATKDNFNTLEIFANGKLSSSLSLSPHYQKEHNKITTSAFIVNLEISENEKQSSEIFIELQFSNQEKKFIQKLKAVEIKSLPIKNESRHKDEIAILMPTYNPVEDSFKKQLHSILNQSNSNFTLFIQDDCSEISAYEAIKKSVSGNKKIILSRNEKNLGFYKNIENMLYAVSTSFKYICFVDQDDEWMLHKLESQLNFITAQKVDFVYSNLKISSFDGTIIFNSFWTNRSNHINNFQALIQNNCATGSTILFKSHLLNKILPFPVQIGKVYHDHWVCAKSKSIAKVKYQDEVFVNYIQHQQNVTGFHKFKKLPIYKRLKEFLSLVIICVKIIVKKDLKSLENVIEANQNVYYLNYQRIKIFYHKLKNYKLNSLSTEIIILGNTLLLSIKTLSSKYYFNRSEVAIYSAIIFNFALNIRKFIRK